MNIMDYGIIVVITFASFAFGIYAGIGTTNDKWEAQAIAAGYASYAPDTAKFTWKVK